MALAPNKTTKKSGVTASQHESRSLRINEEKQSLRIKIDERLSLLRQKVS